MSKTKTVAPKMTTGAELAERLIAERLARGLSWPDFAQMLSKHGPDKGGIPIDTVYKIGRGISKRPHDTTIARITRALDALPAV